MALNFRSLGNALRGTLRFLDRLGGGAPAGRPPAGNSRGPAPAGRGAGTHSGTPGGLTGTYPGDFRGTAKVQYCPAVNGLPEPGEIVWTWVPFEEDHSRGKDRPVLLVGSRGRYLLALMLTSKDHDGDERRADDYVDLGTGPWDRQGRPSEARLDRILQINPRDVRREGAILDAGRFRTVATALRGRHDWS
jgi:PemK-like, MazF-like toxin of type II toxin-antitoxin system